MKRKDAFRKLRTICQRLDELDPADFDLHPLRLYLFGSVLTDKPDPKDIDLVLVYEEPPGYDQAQIYYDHVAGRPAHYERAIIHLRRGMKMVSLGAATRSLKEWIQSALLLENPICPVWEPGADWAAVLDEIESSPLRWAGARAPDSLDQFKAYVKNLPREERESRLAQAVAEAEAQQLPQASK